MNKKTSDLFVESSMDNFQEMLQASFSTQKNVEGKVVQGIVCGLEDDIVLVDVGLKSEGRIPLKEFGLNKDNHSMAIGDKVDVYVERYEDKNGEVQLSHEKAKQEAVWTKLLRAFEEKKPVEGVMVSRVKGGFTVDLQGATGFLPGSQVDIRPIKEKDMLPLLGTKQPLIILKMESMRTNIVVSRRAVMEESRSEDRKTLLNTLKQGDRLEGIVKNITDYGAFVDLGGVDGLLHVTDIAWKRIQHTSDVLSIGQTISVMVTRFNKETERISLGMKQLEKDPWEDIQEKYKVRQKVPGIVTNVTDSGAFVSIEEGVEGLVYISEMAWNKKNIIPSKIVEPEKEVEVMILEIDSERRRISLGLKQCLPNPLEEFQKVYGEKGEIEGEVKDITEFGLIVKLSDKIEGTVHKNELSWDLSGNEALKKYHVGDKLSLKINYIDPQKELLSLSVKQLTLDPAKEKFSSLKKDMTVTCEIKKITDAGVEVRLLDGKLTGFIKKMDLSRDRREQNASNFAIGEKIDAKIISLQPATGKIMLSIKALEREEERKAIEEFGSSSSGARLGNILGAAFEKAKDQESDTIEED